LNYSFTIFETIVSPKTFVAFNIYTPEVYDLMGKMVLQKNVQAGAALYFYEYANNSWYKVSEYESLDVVQDWSKIQNIPVPLTKIGEDTDGFMTYNGKSVVISGEHEW
jgi:hypothetical protein